MKDFFWKPKYCFLRNGHAYFGKDVRKTVFDKEVQCYVFVDKYNALKGHTKYMSDHPEEYEQFSFKEQAWQQVKYGYFCADGQFTAGHRLKCWMTILAERISNVSSRIQRNI